MKSFMAGVVIVALGLTAAARAERQVVKELEPSLRILQTTVTPMPDFRDAGRYYAMPAADGTMTRGTGHSDWVKGWFSQMASMIPEFAKHDERLRQDVDVYADTVREEGENVLSSTSNLKQMLAKLDKATSGKVQDLLAEYNDEVKATRVARSEFDAATKRAEEAGYLLTASDAGAKECNLLLEKAKLEAEKAALLARMQKGRTFLNTVEKAITAMAGGPQQAVSYVTGELTTVTTNAAKEVILDAFYSGTRETLYEIGMKIEAIDKSLGDLACQQQSAALKAAKSNLEARLIQALVAYGKILDHRARAWRAVDRLGTLQHPQSGRKLPFFVTLQTYNSQVNTMGRKVFESIDGYLAFLARGPLPRGEFVLHSVEQDLETVARDRRDPSGNWTSVANDTKAYLTAYTKWYDGEVTRGQRAMSDLREGRHLDFVDRMLARATRELGGTVSYDDIIR